MNEILRRIMLSAGVVTNPSPRNFWTAHIVTVDAATGRVSIR